MYSPGLQVRTADNPCVSDSIDGEAYVQEGDDSYFLGLEYIRLVQTTILLQKLKTYATKLGYIISRLFFIL